MTSKSDNRAQKNGKFFGKTSSGFFGIIEEYRRLSDLPKTWNLLFCTVYSLEKESRDSVCTLVCYKESKFTHLISVVSSKFFAIMFRGKQFDVGEKTTIMTLFTEGMAPMPNRNQNCVLISPKVVHRRFQVPPPKSNEKPVFCIS